MTTLQTAANPFMLMMDPESVFAAMARSDRLARLTSRVCRPLDKPLIAHAGSEASVEDGSIDAAAELDEPVSGL